MTIPLLSVVIPAWNRARVVSDAVESALIQRAGRVEVIVVDDASTDDTLAVLSRRFGSRIRVLRMPERRGPGAARNAGVRIAGGELLAFLDSDDVWLPGKLDAELRALERMPNAEAVISDSQTFTHQERGGRGSDDETRFALNGLLAACGGDVRMVADCPWLWTNSANGVATCSITIRRDAALRLGLPLFAEDLDACEDWELELRLYHHCRVVVLPEVWSHVRRFDDGTRTGRDELTIARDRRKVMQRSTWLTGLTPELQAEWDRCLGEPHAFLGSSGSSEFLGSSGSSEFLGSSGSSEFLGRDAFAPEQHRGTPEDPRATPEVLP